MTVKILQPDADTAHDAQIGDVLLRPRGEDQVELARMTESGPEWLGAVDRTTLPPLDSDPATLEIAVQGVETALNQRGG